MNELPDLKRLSVAEKDQLIRELWSLVQKLSAQVESLEAKVAELEGRLAKNSRNSSQPPSADGLNKPKPKSLRAKGKRPSGGQKGHPGSTLKQVTHPDRIVTHGPVGYCEVCQRRLVGQGAVVERRQIFDLPALRYEVTEHQVVQIRCACGKTYRGHFPPGVAAPVQYGSATLAAVVYLTHHHMLPMQRTATLMGDFFGLPLSQGTVQAACQQAQARLMPMVEAIGRAIQAAPVAHADETGLRVAGSLQWAHVLATPLLTWMANHVKRGKAAFQDLALLPDFQGTLIHDGWKPYRDLACTHSLCNAHHLRELTYIVERHKQVWAEQLIDLLLAACHEVATVGGPLPPERLAYFRQRYAQLLQEGDTANPRAPPSGRWGQTKQSFAANLLARLRTYADDVWRFATTAGVPFSNNIAEQAVRMPKVKQKVSGGFRTPAGLATFCTIRSYLATRHKQGANLFQALILTFQGQPSLPRCESERPSLIGGSA